MNLKRTAKAVINRMVKPWGMELAYSHVVNRPEVSRDWLRALPIRTVLDIGANVGQFAMEIRDILPDAFIYSFEPLGDAHASLVSNMRGDRKFQAYNFAIGDQNARTLIHRSSFSDSSSLLPMLDRHKAAWPHTAGSTREEIEVRRLDSLELPTERDLLVKIDVQGLEDKVIAGGQHTISRATYIITEVSFELLYEGQPLFDDIYRILKGMGFDYRGSWWQLPDPRDGRPLQSDAIFIKPTSAVTWDNTKEAK